MNQIGDPGLVLNRDKRNRVGGAGSAKTEIDNRQMTGRWERSAGINKQANASQRGDESTLPGWPTNALAGTVANIPCSPAHTAIAAQSARPPYTISAAQQEFGTVIAKSPGCQPMGLRRPLGTFEWPNGASPTYCVITRAAL
jgi:hypothetical protein